VAENHDDDGFGFDLVFGAVVGCGLFVWQALQREWVLAATLLVLCAFVLPPITYGKTRLRRWLMPRAEAAGTGWVKRHAAGSRRLRWVVFPIVGGILLATAVSIMVTVWNVVT
jgi:hypothetical protein